MARGYWDKLEHLIIEDQVPFSQSILWKFQDQAYTEFGPEAWSKMGVPSYLTSHPLLARAYAAQIRAFLNDNQLHTATIVDLGAGTGRLAFYLLEELSDCNINCIVTDITEKHLQHLREHPKLKPYFESGKLQAIQYHHEAGHPPQPNCPTIIIANYYMDTLPQTLYRASEGELEEGFVTLEVAGQTLSAETLPSLKASYTFNPVHAEFPSNYAAKIQNGIFLEPHGGLKTLNAYFEGQQPFLLLTADQGVATQAQCDRLIEPTIAKHGTFSVTVDYLYLKSLLQEKGLAVILPEIPDTTLVFMTATNKPSAGLTRAFRDTIDAISPTDYFHLSNAVESGAPDLQQLMSLIKLGAYDPINTYLFFDQIKKLAKDSELKDELAQVICLAIRTFFPINQEEAIFYNQLGVLLFDLKFYQEALICFQQYLKFAEPTPEILQNIASCLAFL